MSGRSSAAETIPTRPEASGEASLLALADALEHASDGVFVVDRHWRLEYANKQAHALLEAPPELLGREIWAFYPEVVGTPFWDCYRDAMACQVPCSVEAFYEPLGRWFEAHAYPSPERLVVFVRDISERKAAENALRAGEERLRLAQEATGIVAWDHDLGTRRITWLGAWRELYGFGADEEFDFDRLLARIHPDDRARVTDRVRRAVENGERYDVTYRIILPDGRVRWLATRGTVLRDDSGRAQRLIGTNIDVSERFEAQIARERRARRLRLLGEIAAALLATTDPERVLEPLFPLLAEEFGLAAMFSYVPETGDEGTLRLVLHAGVTEEVIAPWRRLPVGVAVCGGVARDRAPFHIDRLQESDDPRGAIVRQLGFRAYACEPLVIGGRFLGTLSFASGRSDSFTDEDRAFFRTVASYVAVVRDRLRAEEELVRFNETLESRIAAAVAERQQAELAFAQAQKMETLGQLTGGIAHDFNNLLTVIQGNLELLEHRLPEDPRLSRLVDAIRQAANRGERLTGQLLAFARRQRLEPEIAAVGPLVEGFAPLVRRAVGESVTVRLRLDEQVAPVLIDPAQFESALLNLAVNARDAMPKGGRLEIAVRPADSTDERLAELVAPASTAGWIAVEVRDTGVGMKRETLERAFEPFFTTKDVGRGSGLGLSQVYGFVRQSGGHVVIESAPDAGTRVLLYLPQAQESSPAAPCAAAQPAADEDDVPEGQGETVLVVEDDEEVRALAVSMLEGLRYRVATASNGPEALSILCGDRSADLVFTDIVMPGGMSGIELGRAAQALRPGIKVLLTTGYAAEVVTHQAAPPVFPLLQKPYKRDELARRVRAALA
jgi:PAS domain S-box-containing protein